MQILFKKQKIVRGHQKILKWMMWLLFRVCSGYVGNGCWHFLMGFWTRFFCMVAIITMLASLPFSPFCVLYHHGRLLDLKHLFLFSCVLIHLLSGIIINCQNPELAWDAYDVDDDYLHLGFSGLCLNLNRPFCMLTSICTDHGIGCWSGLDKTPGFDNAVFSGKQGTAMCITSERFL